MKVVKVGHQLQLGIPMSIVSALDIQKGDEFDIKIDKDEDGSFLLIYKKKQ